jgi:hypothetical protein
LLALKLLDVAPPGVSLPEGDVVSCVWNRSVEALTMKRLV